VPARWLVDRRGALQILSAGGNPDKADESDFLDHFEATYEDIWEEVTKYGEVEEMMIADNLADHLIGSVWVRFFREEDALACLK
jgi:splicing factor U2AF 35 kDa subunit